MGRKYKGVHRGRNKKARLARRDGLRCYLCGDDTLTLDELRVEHKVPHSRGGGDNMHNLGLACRPCDVEKGDMTASEYWEYLQLRPSRGITGSKKERHRIRESVKGEGKGPLMYGLDAYWPRPPAEVEEEELEEELEEGSG